MCRQHCKEDLSFLKLIQLAVCIIVSTLCSRHTPSNYSLWVQCVKCSLNPVLLLLTEHDYLNLQLACHTCFQQWLLIRGRPLHYKSGRKMRLNCRRLLLLQCLQNLFQGVSGSNMQTPELGQSKASFR